MAPWLDLYIISKLNIYIYTYIQHFIYITLYMYMYVYRSEKLCSDPLPGYIRDLSIGASWVSISVGGANPLADPEAGP